MPSTLYSEGWKKANPPPTDYILNYLSLLKKKKKTQQPKPARNAAISLDSVCATCSYAAYPKEVPLSHPSPKLLLSDGREHNSCHRTRTDEVLKWLRVLGAAVEAAQGEKPVPG